MARRRDVVVLAVSVIALAAGVGSRFVTERWQMWLLVGAAVWLGASVLLSLGLGLLIARRDEQIPTDAGTKR